MNRGSKYILFVLIFFCSLFIVQSAFAGFELYDTLPFGGKLRITGNPTVTTNASTNVFCNSSTLNGYLDDDGGLDTATWFEYGQTIAYGTNTGSIVNTTFYFDDYDAGEAWGINPEDMVDGDLGTVAMCTDLGGDTENIYFGSFPSSFFNCSIIKNVKIRCYYLTTIGISLRPQFLSGDGTKVDFATIDLLTWSSWTDITNDTNAPSTWNRNDIENLECDVIAKASGWLPPATACAKVEVKVVYQNITNSKSTFKTDIGGLLPDTTYHYRAVANNSNGTVYGSDVEFKTLSTLYDSPNSSFVEENDAVLQSHLYSDLGEATTCGFWVGNVTTSKTSFEQNVTCAGTYNSGETFSSAITSLTSGEYYYARSWMYNSHGFFNSTNETYFITKPNAPTGFTFDSYTADTVTISWTSASAGAGTNRTTVIVYNTGGYPTTPSDGTVCYNDTGSSTTVSSLSGATTYYFSAWTYVNDSGSPLLGLFSDGFVTTSGHTAGGNYNISIRYEDNLTLVSNAVMADYLHSCEARLYTGQMINATYNIVTNPFEMNLTYEPDVMFFDFKNRTLKRAITPETGVRNVTFYVTDRPEYATGLNVTECQIMYTFSFRDPTMYFIASNLSQLQVFRYNNTEIYYIHQDYWSAEDTVDVPLQYGTRYYLGVSCPNLDIPFLQYFDALETTAPLITITYIGGFEPNINEYVYVNVSWAGGGNGIWVNYTDSSFQTNSFNISFYEVYKNNVTQTLRHTVSFALSQKDYQWTTALGCNGTDIYYITIEIDHAAFTTNQSIKALLFPAEWPMHSPIFDTDWIEAWFESILGDSPFVDTNPDSPDYGTFVPWTQIIAFGACLMLLMTIGHINMPLSMIGVGLLLIILELCLGLVVTRDVVGTSVGVLGGILLVILGIIVFLGGRKG